MYVYKSLVSPWMEVGLVALLPTILLIHSAIPFSLMYIHLFLLCIFETVKRHIPGNWANFSV